VSRAAAGETGRPLFIATGSNYPDALSAGPAAAALGGSVLLVDGAASGLSGPTKALIDSLDPSAIVVVGGPAGVSDRLLRQMQSRYGGSNQVFRIGGPDRYSVSVLLNSVVFAESPVAFVATGTSFADALAGGPLVARYGAPLYLTQPECLPSSVSADITALRAADVVVLGGTGAVSSSVTRGAVCRGSAASAPVMVPASALAHEERTLSASLDSMREVLGSD
jgi:putative cell wall-binding protein